MDKYDILAILEQVKSGGLSVQEAFLLLKKKTF